MARRSKSVDDINNQYLRLSKEMYSRDGNGWNSQSHITRFKKVDNIRNKYLNNAFNSRQYAKAVNSEGNSLKGIDKASKVQLSRGVYMGLSNG